MSLHLVFDAGNAERRVSSTLFGLFLEDINFACDGGLNANQVTNHSFGGVYAEPRGFVAFVEPRAATRVVDRLRHWSIEGGSLVSSVTDPFVPDGWFGRVESEGLAALVNAGYPGDPPGLALRAGVPMRFSALLRPQGFTGTVRVELVDGAGRSLTDATLAPLGEGWQRVQALLQVGASASASLQIVFQGGGAVDVDEVALVSADHWGAGDPRWSQGVLRRDLVETLRDLHPTFLRFPGGCIVEGHGDGNAYDWKRTVGPIESRRPDYNLWADFVEHGSYSQSFQIGFYEYFLLCEDLGVEPMPIVSAGLACQFRVDEVVDLESDAFARLVQDVVDLVDWATGDPGSNEWAALRAAAGHPEPFPLNYLGIGNENFGPAYFERFDRIAAAVDAHRPGITFVFSAGAAPDGDDFVRAWDHARTHGDRVIVDEHFYNTPEWVLGQAHRYDEYPRVGPKVFLGEYAAHFPMLSGVPDGGSAPANTFETALAEAAFLTGVERNSDIVTMTCYAPLLHRLGAGQWGHNLIDFTGDAVIPTANYFVQQLFAATTGDRVAESDGMPLPEGIFASSTTTAAVQYVKLVNTNDVPTAARIVVPAARAAAATTTLLHAERNDRNLVGADGAPVCAVRPVRSSVPIEEGTVSLDLPAQSLLVLEIGLAGADASDAT
jgi:alpha-L-arabinofuranosidase